jgi:hypothetical protein
MTVYWVTLGVLRPAMGITNMTEGMACISLNKAGVYWVTNLGH